MHSFSRPGSGKTRPWSAPRFARNLAGCASNLIRPQTTGTACAFSGAGSAVGVFVIPTNEELMIAQHTLALVAR